MRSNRNSFGPANKSLVSVKRAVRAVTGARTMNTFAGVPSYGRALAYTVESLERWVVAYSFSTHLTGLCAHRLYQQEPTPGETMV
jgi:hypothetical protein